MRTKATLTPLCGGLSVIGAGKQLVQYTPVQIFEPVDEGGGGADLPSLLELEAEPFLGSDPSASFNSDL